MTGWRRRFTVVLAISLLVVGAWGTYSYARDYDVHRGFPAVKSLPGARAGRVVHMSFYSRALGRRADYIAYLPPGYDLARRYPVLYLLHGMPGHPAEFVTVAHLNARLDNLISQHQARSMILVFPDGRIHGQDTSDSEWANTPSGNYANYVMEVVHNVDSRFATLAARQDRIIGGFSAGAYGALNIALHHLDDFASVQVWSGYFTQTHSGVFAHASRSVLAANSPYDEVVFQRRVIRAKGLRVFLYGGQTDPDTKQLRPMVARLHLVGADVSWAIYPGGHDWALWVSQADAMLRLASRDFGSTPAHGPAATQPAQPAGQLTRNPAPALASVARRSRPVLSLLAALALAFLSGTLINLGFVLQHRGIRHHRAADEDRRLACLRDPIWLAGQLIGWIGWAGAVVAVALAPLTLVQAFAAGSLGLSTLAAAALFRVRVTRAQIGAVALITMALVVLAVGDTSRHRSLSSGVLIGLALTGGALAAGLVRAGRPGGRAVAAGLCYGICDALVKADAIGLHQHGVSALASGWTVLALAFTLGGFATFQSALAHDTPVTAVSLMNAFCAIAATVLGVTAFGEHLGNGALAIGVHVVAIAVVLACVWPLAGGEAEVLATEGSDAYVPEGSASPASSGRTSNNAQRRLGRPAVRGFGAVLAVLMAVVAGTGLLYLLHVGGSHHSSEIADALPLLVLAGHAAQPAAPVVVTFGVCGIALGILLRAMRPGVRLVVVALLGSGLLWVTADACQAIALNLRFTQVLSHSDPGLGPWLQAALLCGGCVVVEVTRGVIGRRMRPERYARAPWRLRTANELVTHHPRTFSEGGSR